MAVNAQGQEAVIVRNGRVKVRIWTINAKHANTTQMILSATLIAVAVTGRKSMSQRKPSGK